MKFEDISKQIADVSRNYHFHKPPDFVLRIQEVIARIWRFILDLLDWIFNRGHHFGGSDSRSLSSLLQILIYSAGALAMLVLAFVLWRRLRQQSLANKRLRKGASQIEELLDASGWKEQAHTLSASADYRGACRALYLSLLQYMHENHLAEFAPTRTNYEYSYALSSYPDIQKGFRQISNLVELIWFGNKEASAADYEETLQALAKLEPAVAQTDAARKSRIEAQA